MSTSADYLREFRVELATTRRVLERIPADKLSWKPHPKSMSIGTLGLHIASLPGRIAAITKNDAFEFAGPRGLPPDPASKEEIFAALEGSVKAVEDAFNTATDETANATWRMMRGDREIFVIPRVVAWRSMMLNHWYHHRGQLSVYLRLLDVPLPSMYGPSADENPFG